MRLRCTNCDAVFDEDRAARCPKCLRLTTVIEDGDVAPAPREGTPAPWPAGTACPLCLVGPVSDATFHLEIAAGAPPGAARRASALTFVRCRCCGSCRRRVVTLARLRVGALPIVGVGMLVWPLSLATDLPFRLWGIDRIEVAMLSTLVCAVVVGVPLFLLDHANRSMRRNLERSWLFRRVRERVSPVPARESVVGRDDWRLLAGAPRGATAVDATELVDHI